MTWLAMIAALSWLVCARFWRKRGNSWIEIALSLTGLFAVLFIAHQKEESDCQHVRDAVRTSLMQDARRLARWMDQMGHYKLKTGASMDDAEYVRVLDAERRWMRDFPGAASIYTVRKGGNGKYVFVSCAEADLDKDGKICGSREDLVPSGEAYDDVPIEFEAAFKHGSGFSPAPMADKWGSWVTAAYALKDPAGRTEAILGVDFPADQWIQDQETARRDDVLTASLFVILYLVLISTKLRFFMSLRAAELAGKQADSTRSTARITMEVAEGWAQEADADAPDRAA